jgi:hypothetical protein
MSISERDVKVLWGRAAGRCTICKIPVTADKQTVTDAYPFGEAAHIVAEKAGGPRGDDGLPDYARNNYLNLMLLCPNCHTKIDKAPEDFSVKRLLQLKSEHESEVSRLNLSDKDDYDEFLQFSRVTAENWMSPDRKNYIPIDVTREQWIALFMEPRLDANVSRKVIRAFEVARACMIYSWFFYPLAALGLEQLLRVGKLAVHECCCELEKNSENLDAELKALADAKIITSFDEVRWQALGRLTDDRAFLAGATLFDGIQAVSTLRLLTNLINGLFLDVSKKIPSP